MFNVPALLLHTAWTTLDDALSKFVVTEVVWFSIIAVKTMTFHKVV